MSFFGKIVSNLFSREVPPETVQEVNVTAYTNFPVIAREEGLILYGPTQDRKYELLLQQPIERNNKTAFSLFRLDNLQSATDRFVVLRDVLVPLCYAPCFDLFNQRQLQEIMNIQREHPTWRSAHLAAKLGLVKLFDHPEIAKYCNTSELDFRETPLHIAIREKNIATVQALLRLDVSLDVVDVKGNSVYHVAAAENKEIIQALTTKPTTILLNAPNNAGKTPLHLACEADKPDCVTALLLAGADVNVASTMDSSLAIHSALQADSTPCVKEILQRYPNMLHVQDMKNGGTPLHWAKSKKMVNALIELKCHVNAKNFEGRTALHLMVAHDRLGCVLALLSHGALPHLTDNKGNTALHGATSLAVLQALVVFEAPLDKENLEGETPRHVIASLQSPNKSEMVFALHAVGAKRCPAHTSSCSSGCSHVGSNNGAPAKPMESTKGRVRSPYDSFLDEIMCSLETQNAFPHSRGGRLLCLDGGGIRGLVLIVLLRAIQREAGDRPVTSLFDWIAGTSTGAILALALAMGRSPQYALNLYFKLKDEVFVGGRPYAEGPLEDVLKKEFGEKTVMTDIKDVKVVVTGVLADRYPADLHLFRNYSGGEELLANQNTIADVSEVESPHLQPVRPPSQQLVWEAARASGAAPSYFRAYGRYIDGGLIANNPSVDLLTEISERNAILGVLRLEDQLVRPTVLVSLGTGKPPLEKVNAIDCFRPETLYGSLQMAFGLSNMAKILIDQVTMADNHTVDRCRAWCQSVGVKYVRLSPQLGSDVPLDETRDEVLLQMLWETLAFCHARRRQIQLLAKMLSAAVLME